MNLIINRDDRHAPLKTRADPLSPDYLLLIEKLFKHQSSSEFLSVLSKIPYKLRECCKHELDNKLDEDPFYIPIKLIEIKCPYLGKTDNIIVVIQNLTYVRKDQDNNFVLKQKHTYYAQLQFGMALLNLTKTDCILFASYDKSIKIVTVDFDKEFAKDLLFSLKSSFFNNMLHYLCKCNVPVTYLLLIYNNELSSFLISKELVQISKVNQGRG